MASTPSSSASCESCLTIFETSQIIAQELEFSSLGYMELMETQNDVFSTLNCNFKAINHMNGGHGAQYTPRSFKDAAMAKQCILKQLSFVIASYIIAPNGAFQSTLIESVCSSQLIDTLSIPLSIIQTIVKRFLFGIRWDIPFIQKSMMSLSNSAENEDEDDDMLPGPLLMDTDSSSDSEQSVNDIHSESKYSEVFDYNLNDCLIRYPLEIIDALHVATSFEINLSEYQHRNYQFIFHFHINHKGDESWIGLMNKESFKTICEYHDKLSEETCVLYYGGRERCIDTRLAINGDILNQLSRVNTHHGHEIERALMSYLNRDGHGSIYANGQCLMDKLKPFRTGDWISVCIERDVVSFYNNGQLIHRNDLKQNKLYNKDLVLFSLVDYDNDAIFVEQSYCKNGLQD